MVQNWDSRRAGVVKEFECVRWRDVDDDIHENGVERREEVSRGIDREKR